MYPPQIVNHFFEQVILFPTNINLVTDTHAFYNKLDRLNALPVEVKPHNLITLRVVVVIHVIVTAIGTPFPERKYYQIDYIVFVL